MLQIISIDTLVTNRRKKRIYRSPNGRIRGNHQCRLVVRREDGSTTSVFAKDIYTFGVKKSYTTYKFTLDGKRHVMSNRFTDEVYPPIQHLVGATWASAEPWKSPF